MARRNTEHRTKNKQLGTRVLLSVLCSVFSVLLSGCLLTSGEQTSADAQATGGNFNTTFVSAEGGQERTIATGAGPTTLSVIATVHVQQGELRLEMLAPDSSVVLSIRFMTSSP